MTPVAKKKDPSITFLNKFGYNVIRLPRTGIEAMDVVGRDETTQWLGPISDVWQSGPSDHPNPVPQPITHPAVAVNGQRTDALDLSLGLSVLANTLAAFGATVPSLNVAYKSAHSVQFAYTNVTSSAVEPFAAGNYLEQGTLRTSNPIVKNYFLGETSKAYLITEVLKSDSITVTATDSHGVNVGVSIPALQGVLGAKIGVNPTDSSNSSITFTGPVAVTFGFKVQQIIRDNDSWILHGAAASPEIAFAVPNLGMGLGMGMSTAPLATGPTIAADETVFDTGGLDCRLSI
jgi:hypothetical protein